MTLVALSIKNGSNNLLAKAFDDPHYEGVFCGAMKCRGTEHYHIILRVTKFSTREFEYDLKEQSNGYSLILLKARIQPVVAYTKEYKTHGAMKESEYCSRGVILPDENIQINIPEDREIQFWPDKGVKPDEFGISINQLPSSLRRAGFRIRPGAVFTFPEGTQYDLVHVDAPESEEEVNVVDLENVQLCDSPTSQS